MRKPGHAGQYSASVSPEYRWPGEWEPHRTTLLAWPHRDDLWSGKLAAVQERFLEIIAALLPHEPVCLLVPDESAADRILSRLPAESRALATDARRLQTPVVATDDIWIRDYGPLHLLANARSDADRLLAYTFNGWGHKFEAELDNAAARRIARIAGQTEDLFGRELAAAELIETDFVLEGGAIESNGDGLIMTTEACLLHPNRNPDLVSANASRADKRAAVHERLLRDFHASDVLWLPGGRTGDDTDGHIDMVARFIARDRVIACLPDDATHPSYAALHENLAALRAFRFAADQTPLHVTTLPMPPLRYTNQGDLLPESYANFYIANGCVLVPVFGYAESDARALEIIAGEFPDRETVPISGSELILEGGGIHCATMNLMLR